MALNSLLSMDLFTLYYRHRRASLTTAVAKEITVMIGPWPGGAFSCDFLNPSLATVLGTDSSRYLIGSLEDITLFGGANSC